ncbi:metalloprotease TldD [Blochmannia endosymbiont of Polyrhachis (Hedomyrma) turneri]|uniref:metalloprotease TldD n=1 Tax=Blochmannia endosymbiont of Polyrhachis (Hedomyrma) turneri TaxID=1505596 RepID=UPI00061A7C40|nr:metalloprotease TldD [Blochmannia endosymbiont of Polyrhachis (Hedomyrma) turneri]AKC59841.1 Protein tldD [Blochmannia endosymbiont of Polyrhachis (Hedomyrma) turneri]
MNSNNVIDNILSENNLQTNDVLNLLDTIHTKNTDYADFYFQSNYHETWVLENGIIKTGRYSIDNGVGIRIIKGEKTGFSYTNQLNIDSLIQSIKTARNILINDQNENNIIYYVNNNKIANIKKNVIQHVSTYSNQNPLTSFSEQQKIELLMQINKLARKIDTRIEEIIAVLSGTYEEILIMATDGTLSSDIRPLVQLSINVQISHNGKREQGRSGGGGRHGYEFFLNPSHTGETILINWIQEAVKMAINNISAIEAPAGSMPVVLKCGWAGILLHEAVGHGLEGDFNRYCTSAFTKNIGKQVASELCTVVDDGTVKNARGSLNIDDEGTPGQFNILIEKGILKKYMQDKLNAKLMNMAPTGNGRRESYSNLPMPRMTNTYMLAGESTEEEIISSVNYGIYASNFSGGQVDITSGKFVFSTSEAFLIEKGYITKPVKGVTLIGSGIEVMNQISMVANNLKLDTGIGTCMKNGQSLPVGVGQPTIKINQITIGGTA